MNLDRFSQAMPWEQPDPMSKMYDLCLDCGKEIPFGKSYCSYCEDRRYEVNEVKKELIYLKEKCKEKCKQVVSILDRLIVSCQKKVSVHRAIAEQSKDHERGLNSGMAIAYEILAQRLEEIKKELQEAAN